MVELDRQKPAAMTEPWFSAYDEARRDIGLTGPADPIKGALYFQLSATPEEAAGQDRAHIDRPFSEPST